MYFEMFESNDDIIKEYAAPKDALDGAEVLIAWYGAGSYCGDSFVLFRKDGVLYENHGGHCSCYGLEGQWDPEETSIEALEKREFYSEYDGHKEVKVALDTILEALKK